MKGTWYLWMSSYTCIVWNLLPIMGIMSSCLGIGTLGLSLDSLLPSMIGNHDTSLFLALDGKRCLMTFGDPISWCFFSNFFQKCNHSLDTCFTASERPDLESHYQSPVETALEFAHGIDDFNNLVDPHHLYNHCLGPEPSKYVLRKILQEEKSTYTLFS